MKIPAIILMENDINIANLLSWGVSSIPISLKFEMLSNCESYKR